MRYLKITVSGAALFLVYLWITVMMNSCNNNPSKTNSSSDIEILDDERDDSDFTDGEFEGEDAEDYTSKSGDDSDENDYSSESASDEIEEDEDYEAGDYTSTEQKTKVFPSSTKKSNGNTKLQPRSKTKETNKKTYTSSSSSGEYMVIAGSYLLEENANKMIRKLKSIGYSNAEIIYFNQSQYHSICAGRYNSNSSASQTASELRSSGIDSYVHKKQND